MVPLPTIPFPRALEVVTSFRLLPVELNLRASHAADVTRQTTVFRRRRGQSRVVRFEKRGNWWRFLGHGAPTGAREASRVRRVLLNTLVPVRRDRTVELDLPKVQTAADALAASSAVLAACSRGEITPNEASEVMTLISTHVRMIEVADLEERLAALEKSQQK
jgi:hypothetical protein